MLYLNFSIFGFAEVMRCSHILTKFDRIFISSNLNVSNLHMNAVFFREL